MKYATDPQVRETIYRWRGNVVHAADALGIQPKNLRKRLKRLGIDLAAVRAGERYVGATPPAPMTPRNPHDPAQPPQPRPAPTTPMSVRGRQSAGGPYEAPAPARKFPAVAQSAAVDETDALPLAGARRTKPARLEPPNQERVADGRRQLSALYGRDLDDTEILNRHFAATWDEWFQKELARAKTATKRRAAKTGGGPEEK